MITQRIAPLDFISIVPPRIARAEPRMSLDQLRARFARNDGLPFSSESKGLDTNPVWRENVRGEPPHISATDETSSNHS